MGKSQNNLKRAATMNDKRGGFFPWKMPRKLAAEFFTRWNP
jgi:hypothetical protein